ncbi:MAG: hypothetical protein A3G34_08160 [Candidatus Lindowbacteria bacterium RIFCSPLOWO2_12_FULL_62_27]|nr:MAG: hypothetical protein A3G34_08160 [Candidatus Lindowbacteria bacterium RIFCSPLOWO2_12_FULL_62_27]OGH62333.1 MAG: hypothetical protein A3I06_00260 [Candidatus Lindowbacteria bacterium RIFCSPLOWO2_02_FULL_62_12]
MESRILDDLNPAQREAAACIDGPLLIFAGAGTGKTRVITHRIAHLIYDIGIPPENILAVTFTNKAAGVMRERLVGLAEGSSHAAAAGRVFFATFHRFCAWLLRRHGEAVGIPKRFTIYDDADSLHVIRQILKSMNLESSIYRPAAIAAIIDRAKNDLRGPQDIEAAAEGPVEEKTAGIFVEYERRLRAAGALDFTDLLVFAVRLLESAEPVRKHLQEKFSYVLVDEYQDTNLAQYRLLRSLAAHGNLCVVGDDDQAIYSWRGADVRNILSFEKDFPAARVVKLEQNYRSTQGILDLAYRVIRNNRDRADKRLVTHLGPGDAPTVYAAADGYDEASFVSGRVRDLESDLPYNQMAVFFRMSAQSRLIEEEFLARGIPYVVVSGVGFYERREVKDLLAYLRVIANPADDAALERILNVPKRGIGDTSAAALAECARAAGVSQADMLNRLDQVGASAMVKKRLADLAHLLQELRRDAADRTIEETLRRTVAVTNYFDYLEKTDPPGFEERAANVQELYTVAQEFANRVGMAEGQPPLVAFIEELSLLTDADRADSSADRVSLMTLHAAKGQEFSAVFLIGLEEGSLPHASAFESDAELEEERRLCYVGITRAKRKLFLSHAYSRRIYGETRDDIRPSRFLEEAGVLEEARFQVVDTAAYRSFRRREAPERVSLNDDTIVRVPLDDDQAAFGVAPGDRIAHPHFGEGMLLRISGHAEDATATVKFDRAGRKRLKLAHAKLTRLS